MPRQFSILDLPVKIRELICHYAEFTGFIRDLNYTDLDVYPLHEYPTDEYVESLYCFHEIRGDISRREDYHTLEEYWELSCDRFDVKTKPAFCNDPTCEIMASHSCADYFNDKTTHPELFRIMMQKNHLRVCQGSPGGFQPFFDLSREVLAELGTLTVRLDGEPPESITLGDDWKRLDKLIPYNLRSRYGKSAMKEWEKLVNRLAECILPSTLTLYVITKAPDIETAENILKPLNNLPALRGLGLYLNGQTIPEFNALAKATVERLAPPANRACPVPFRYLDLPQELRYRILEFSDLISKGYLEWKPSLSSISPIPAPRCSCRSDLGRKFYSIGHIDDCTVEMMDEKTIYNYIYDWGISTGEYGPFKSMHCCSNRYFVSCGKDNAGFCACLFKCEHSVYTNTIPYPRVGPHPLFLVSKAVQQDAIPIFFQQNKFVISPPGMVPARFASPTLWSLHPYGQTIPMRRTELSMFLAILPPNALRHIRYLEWVLPQFENYTSAPKSIFFDYEATVEMMEHAMGLSKLTLVLNLRAAGSENRYYEEPRWPKRSPRDRAMYDAILGPLCRLRGLKNCFVYLKRLGSGNRHLGEHGECIFDSDEMRYEKAIMGSTYNSQERGKLLTERFEQVINKTPCIGRYDNPV